MVRAVPLYRPESWAKPALTSCEKSLIMLSEILPTLNAAQ
jgi:hypothetical protein